MSLNLHLELAKQWADQVYALVLTEHWGCPALTDACLTERGDFLDAKDPASFEAFGILQQHPAFLQEYYGKLPEFPARGDHTHPDMQIVAAATFLELRVPELGIDGAIQLTTKASGHISRERGIRYI